MRRKLTVLADAAKYDASCASGGKAGSSDDPERMGRDLMSDAARDYLQTLSTE